MAEGLLQDLGLAATTRMVGGKDGILRISGLGAEGRIYVQDRRIIHVSFGASRGLAALAAINALPGARFAYFPMSFSLSATMELEIGRVQEALK